MDRPGYREFSRVITRLPLGYRIVFRVLFPFFGWRAFSLSVFVPSLFFSLVVVVLIVSLVSFSSRAGSDRSARSVLPVSTSVSTPVYPVSSTYPAPLVLSPVVPTPDPGRCTVWCYPGVDCGVLSSLNPGCNIIIVERK